MKKIRAYIAQAVYELSRILHRIAFRIHPYGYRKDNWVFVNELFETRDIPKEL